MGANNINRRAANRPVDAATRAIEDAERSWVEDAAAKRHDELERRAASARELERSRLRAVQAALVAADEAPSHAAGGEEAVRGLSAARQQARLISVRLEELEEERQRLLASDEARQAMHARLRAEVARGRCEHLQEERRSVPRDARARLDLQRRTVTADTEALHFEHARLQLLSEHEAAVAADRCQALRERLDALLDASEEARLVVASVETHVDARARARRAAYQTAEAASRARLEPLRAELAEVRRQIEAVHLTRELERQQRQQQQKAARETEGQAAEEQAAATLRADVAQLAAELSRLRAEEAELRAQVAALPPPPPPAGRGGGGVDAASAKGAQKAQPPAHLAKRPPPPKGTKLDPSQRDRLAALKGKYGAHVASKMAPGGL